MNFYRRKNALCVYLRKGRMYALSPFTKYNYFLFLETTVPTVPSATTAPANIREIGSPVAGAFASASLINATGESELNVAVTVPLPVIVSSFSHPFASLT